MPFFGYGGYGTPAMAPPRVPAAPGRRFVQPLPPPEEVDPFDDPTATAPRLGTGTRSYSPSAAALPPPGHEAPVELQAGLQEPGEAQRSLAESSVRTRVNVGEGSEFGGKQLFQAPSARMVPQEISLGAASRAAGRKDTLNSANPEGFTPTYNNKSLTSMRELQGGGSVFSGVTGNPLVPDREEAELNRQRRTSGKAAEIERNRALMEDPTGEKALERRYKKEKEVAEINARGRERANYVEFSMNAIAEEYQGRLDNIETLFKTMKIDQAERDRLIKEAEAKQGRRLAVLNQSRLQNMRQPPPATSPMVYGE